MTFIILMAFTIVLLILAALNVGTSRFTLGWGGMAFWALAYLISEAKVPVP